MKHILIMIVILLSITSCRTTEEYISYKPQGVLSYVNDSVAIIKGNQFHFLLRDKQWRRKYQARKLLLKQLGLCDQ